MDGMTRVEARISEVQARFGFAARAVAATVPARAASSSTTATGAPTGSSFRELLDAATASMSSGTNADTTTAAISALRNAGARGVRAPGTYPAITLPAELRGMRNGELPASVLEPIGQGNHRLTRTAAVAFRRMAAAAAKDGVTLVVSDSYRSLGDQARTADDVGLYREGGLAAVPGTSTHGWGLSVDIDVEPRTQQWLRSHAAEYGFAEDVAREPWHYTYRPADL